MADSRRHEPHKRILHGEDEAIFTKLPATVLANLRHPRSENALVWNLLYPRFWPSISMTKLLDLRPLWGTARLQASEDTLVPYFWGFRPDGERLEGLDAVLDSVDGSGPQTEVDLFLRGASHLVGVEAKRSSGFGRCHRFAAGRCPEVHRQVGGEAGCRYWELAVSRFDADLLLGERPTAAQPLPPCHRHYQLARTLRVGRELARRQGLVFHLWLLTPHRHWTRQLKSDWVDLTERVRDDGLWRRLRVLSWEAIEEMPAEPR